MYMVVFLCIKTIYKYLYFPVCRTVLLVSFYMLFKALPLKCDKNCFGLLCSLPALTLVVISSLIFVWAARIPYLLSCNEKVVTAPVLAHVCHYQGNSGFALLLTLANNSILQDICQHFTLLFKHAGNR